MTSLQRRDPAQHHPTSTVRPADFDAFWAEIMSAADRIPLNSSIQPVANRSTGTVDVFEIGYDSLDDVRIAGWYCVPKHAHRAPPFPALLIVPGYISEPTLPKAWAERGYATVGVAPRGTARPQSAAHLYGAGHDAGAYWDAPTVDAFLAEHLNP